MHLGDIPSAADADRSAAGWGTTAWPESASPALRAVARGYAPSDTHPARPVSSAAAGRAAPARVAAIRGSAPLFPASADGECRSNAAGSPAASATTTDASAPKPTSYSTTAYRDPSASPREPRNAGRPLPVAPAPVRLACCRWPPGQSSSGCDHRAPTAAPPLVATLLVP